jgi:Fic family protein
MPLADLAPGFSAEVAAAVSEAEDVIRRLNAGASSALGPLARLLLRTESIASSKVEGLQSDVRDLARAEAKREMGRRVGREAEEVLGNVNAMELALTEAGQAPTFSRDQVRAIHARLMESALRPVSPGEFRTTQNWIGGNDYNPCGADFVPPPPEYIDDLMDDLCEAINSEVWSPLVQAALVHAQFETIHPFDDGNGRTGRALIHVILHRRGLAPAYVPPISVVLAKHRDRYIRGLTEFRGEGVVEWIEQFAQATTTSARLAASYLEAVGELQEAWRGRLSATEKPPRRDAAAWAVIDVLPAHPILSASVAKAATGRAISQVYQAIAQLEDAGVLVPLSTSRRNRSWEAQGLLDLLAELEAGTPPTRSH